MFEPKDKNAITAAISKSMDFKYLLPKEFQEHAAKKKVKTNFGNYLVKSTKPNTLLKTARRVSKLVLGKAKSEQISFERRLTIN